MDPLRLAARLGAYSRDAADAVSRAYTLLLACSREPSEENLLAATLAVGEPWHAQLLAETVLRDGIDLCDLAKKSWQLLAGCLGEDLMSTVVEMEVMTIKFLKESAGDASMVALLVGTGLLEALPGAYRPSRSLLRVYALKQLCAHEVQKD